MPQKILIADDDVETLRLIGLMLQRQGFEIAAAANGVQALEMSQTISPDLIILDVMMPDIDGGDVAASLAETEELKNVPVVFLTAIVTEEETKPTGSFIGRHTFLAKPVNLKNLITCIENHIGA